jgi:hypothetical protein
MRFSIIALLSLAGLAVAVPQGCTSNAWEKLHEGHGHNINTGDVGGAKLGLNLPGGTGCYKGEKVGSSSTAQKPSGLGKGAVGSDGAAGGMTHSRRRHD